MSKERIGWIDVAKGLAMFLVVLGHNPLPILGVQLLYGLNVPIFFLMSGYTFRTEKFPSLFTLIKKLAKRILIPYVVMNILSFFVYHWVRDMAITPESVNHLIGGAFYGEGIRGALMFNQPLWFLPCIFVVQVLWYFLDRYTQKTKVLWVLLSSLAGYFIPAVLTVRLPWGMDVALTGIVFFSLGQFFSKEKVHKALFLIPSAIGFVFTLGINIGFNFLNQTMMPYANMNVDINAMVFGNYFLFYICSLSGCVAIIYLAKLLSFSRALSYLGKYTLWVLGLHSLFIQIFEIKLELRFVTSTTANSLILCVLEIACVLFLKFLYDTVKHQFVRKWGKGEQHEAG
ncbi:MAG: acyltransferase family protein [Clostridia bacterium]|nr:acyltransferase family protein [Clostridia bacterium]